MVFGHLLQAIAVIGFGALLGGRLAACCHIPRVTGYLLVGLLTGPSFAELLGIFPLLPLPALLELRYLSDLALGLILMNIGALVQLDHLRRWRNRILVFSASEIGLTFILVALATSAVNLFILHQAIGDLSITQTSLHFGLFLGIIAVATAPAATLMVIRECEADGPVTEVVLTLVGFNNLVSVLGFTILAHFLVLPNADFGALLFRMFGPIVLGGIMGLALSMWAQRLELASEHKVLLIGGVAALIALCRALQCDFLLASLIFGLVLANSTPTWHRLSASLHQVDYLLYIAFFVIAGANLHIETLTHIGLLGVVYVIARTLGKWLGATFGARWGGFGEREKAFVGLTLLAQAGMAIGLAASLAHHWPVGGKLLETVVLGSVVIFELFGPLAVRQGLVRAGEVPILSLLQKRAPLGTIEGLHNVVHHFRQSLGLPAGHKMRDPGDILVRHIMRQNVETVRAGMPFNELLKFISHSRYDRFPVVDEQGHFLGMIDYTEIRNLLFEPTLAPLVVAGDLVTAAQTSLNPDQPLRSALKILQQHRNISYFPVVDADDPTMLRGILSQNDVLAAFRNLADQTE